MQNFREAVRSGGVQLGTFIRTPSHQVPEVLGGARLDFASVDCEHAPFDLVTLDRMALGARSVGLPCLARVSELASVAIGQVLDLGMGGILVPHVRNADMAAQAVAAAKYGSRARGFSPSTRAANYGGIDARAYRVKADLESSVWCQIEDADALSQLDAIAAVEHVDCLFVGRADLALSLKVESQEDPKVKEAVAATAAAGRRHGRTVGIYIGSTTEIPDLLALGFTVFACGSDQGFLVAQGRRLRAELSAILATPG
jgi:2-keto-3-deoxy-L-rhamnonate aldolase RhmA